MNIEQIELELAKARNVFVAYGKEIDEMYFSRFPNGCCGDASDFLGKWLSGKGGTGLESVYGERPGASHGWLEYTGFILDITSDQFPDGCGDIFVGKNSNFHSTFEPTNRSSPAISEVFSLAYDTFSEFMKRA